MKPKGKKTHYDDPMIPMEETVEEIKPVINPEVRMVKIVVKADLFYSMGPGQQNLNAQGLVLDGWVYNNPWDEGKKNVVAILPSGGSYHFGETDITNGSIDEFDPEDEPLKKEEKTLSEIGLEPETVEEIQDPEVRAIAQCLEILKPFTQDIVSAESPGSYSEKLAPLARIIWYLRDRLIPGGVMFSRERM